MPIELSPLIGLIYDAALDPALWPSVLVEVADFAGGDRAMLISEDRAGTGNAAYFMSHPDPDFMARYFADYIQLNPFRVATAEFVGTGDVYLTTDVIAEPLYRRSRFFTEFLQSRQLVDNSIGVVERTQAAFNILAVQRHDRRGMADESVRQRIGLLLPHVRRSVAIGQAIQMNRLDLNGLSDTLDRMACGIFLLTHEMQIAFANTDGHRLLGEHTVLKSVNGALVFQDRQAGAEVEAALATCKHGGQPDPSGTAILIRSLDGATCIAHLLPLLDGARRASGVAHRAAAVLFVRRIDATLAGEPASFARLYALTPREVAVLATLLQSSSTREIATLLGLSHETIRSHLKSIFQKTGTNRQIDLVKLVANTRSPFM